MPIPTSRDRTGRDDPLDRLSRDRGDEIEVAIVVKHGESRASTKRNNTLCSKKIQTSIVSNAEDYTHLLVEPEAAQALGNPAPAS
jgi:hypothetical protein